MDIGIAIPQSWSEPAQSLIELKEFIRAAEEQGFDSLWVQEQLLGSDPSFEPVVALSYAAALTERVRLGAAGFVAPLRPTLGFAKALASLDQLSLGRLDVGLVLGEMPAAFAGAGIDWSTRAARLEDCVKVLRSLWSDGSATHDSAFSTLRDARMTPKPVQRPGPPIWIGAKARPALARAVKLADGWIGAGGSSFAAWRESLATLRELAEQHGRTDMRIGKKVYLWVDRDEKRALEGLSHWFAVHWGAGSDGGQMARTLGVWGHPQACTDQLLDLIGCGVDLLILNTVGDERNQLDVLTADVLPVLRHAAETPPVAGPANLPITS